MKRKDRKWKRVRTRADRAELFKRIAEEIGSGAARGGCSQECDDLCQGHSGCRLSGATFCLCGDGESFILET